MSAPHDFEPDHPPRTGPSAAQLSVVAPATMMGCAMSDATLNSF